MKKIGVHQSLINTWRGKERETKG